MTPTSSPAANREFADLGLGAVTMGHEATVVGAEGDEEEIPGERPFVEKPQGAKSKGKSGAGVGRKGKGRIGDVARLFIGIGIGIG
ncbi:MAG: hypothetical protein VX815_05990 [Gemmatimonadota bacterium]|nr:hypothetical protein [Gemmatimonadota bacterium]